MYGKSFFLIVLALITVGLLASTGRFMPVLVKVPSTYDPKITVEQAIQTSNTPLLIEFYTDNCHTCQQITPWLANMKHEFDHQVTFVMVDINDPAQQQVAELFGVSYVPAIYVFDFKRMHKIQVSFEAYATPNRLKAGIQKAIADAKRKPDRSPFRQGNRQTQAS